MLAFTLAGCKTTPKVSDASLTTNIQGTLAGDSAIAGQPIDVAVISGVATLGGTVTNDAQRTLAARDAAGVAGVTEVVNNITVGPSTAKHPASKACPSRPCRCRYSCRAQARTTGPEANSKTRSPPPGTD